VKRKPETGKYSQNIHLIKDWFSKCTKNFLNSAIRDKQLLKRNKIAGQTSDQRRHIDGK
jgi:hypothetical protein